MPKLSFYLIMDLMWNAKVNNPLDNTKQEKLCIPLLFLRGEIC